MFKALSGKVTWAEFDGRGDQFRGDFLFSKNPAMDVLLKKILFFLSGIVFLLVMNDSIDRAVFQPFRKAESEKDSSMSSNGINLYADTVFVKKGETILPEKRDSTITFFYKSFNRKNII